MFFGLPQTFNIFKDKKSGSSFAIRSKYVFDNFPLSPFAPLFFPAVEKSGQGGPPINPIILFFSLS